MQNNQIYRQLLANSTLLGLALSNHPKPLHEAAWWAEHTRGFDFSVEDHLDTDKYNRILWIGTMANKSHPTTRIGPDLRANRAQLLKNYEKRSAMEPPSSQKWQKSAASVAAAGPSM